MSYAFFPGCSMEGTGRDYRQSTMAVAQKLGLELPEIPDWVCCGSTAAHGHDPLLAAALPAQSLRAAAAMNGTGGAAPGDKRKVAVACAACFNRLRLANRSIAADPLLRARVAEAIGGDYDGQLPVLHLLEILAHDIGPGDIAAKVRHSLAGLKVVCYYGCLLVRPAEIACDDVENPTLMDQLVRATGAQSLDWPHKTECCGASASVTNPDMVVQLGGKILAMAKDAGADAVVTACPLCQLNLDLRQKDIEARTGRPLGLPVFYFTQLLGLALGCSFGELGLSSLVVDPRPVLARVGLTPAGREVNS
jgi:heterodisulfide reductase subunit B